MWKEHDFGSILNYNYVMNIQDGIGKWFGYRERAQSMRLNAYIGPRLANIPHTTTNCGPGKSKFKMDYYIYKYCCTGKFAHIRKKTWKRNSRSNSFF